MLKILGAAIMMVCGAFLGMKRLENCRRELELLRALDRALGLMEGEIGLCSRPLPELFGMLEEKADASLRDFFGVLREKCVRMSAGQAWAECCAMLPGTEMVLLKPLTAVLGAYDAQRQCSEIALVRRALASEAEEMKSRIASTGRSWPALGACLAGVAAMLII